MLSGGSYYFILKMKLDKYLNLNLDKTKHSDLLLLKKDLECDISWEENSIFNTDSKDEIDKSKKSLKYCKILLRKINLIINS